MKLDLLARQFLEQHARYIRRRILVDEIDLTRVRLHIGDQLP